MEPEYWQARWMRGETGWHKDHVNPWLTRWWPEAGVLAGGRVLVPLCGRSIDLAWLAGQGHAVLGVELSPLAVRQFFEAAGLEPVVRQVGPYSVHSAGGLELACGDFFDLEALDLSDVTGLYDRAALIALPPDLRRRYADVLCRRLPPATRGLTITLGFEQAKKPGPPFSVPPDEVRGHFAERFEVVTLCDSDVLGENPGFVAAGVTSLREYAFGLRPLKS